MGFVVRPASRTDAPPYEFSWRRKGIRVFPGRWQQPQDRRRDRVTLKNPLWRELNPSNIAALGGSHTSTRLPICQRATLSDDPIIPPPGDMGSWLHHGTLGEEERCMKYKPPHYRPNSSLMLHPPPYTLIISLLFPIPNFMPPVRTRRPPPIGVPARRVIFLPSRIPRSPGERVNSHRCVPRSHLQVCSQAFRCQ
jgi:hypothetical protein